MPVESGAALGKRQSLMQLVMKSAMQSLMQLHCAFRTFDQSTRKQSVPSALLALRSVGLSWAPVPITGGSSL